MTGLRAYIGALAVAAGVSGTLAVFDLIDGFDLRRAGALAGGVAAVSLLQTRFGSPRFRGTRQVIYSYEEFLFPVLLVAIGPSATVLSFTSGAVVKNLTDRKSPIKMLFNVSHFTLAAGLGGAVAVLLGGVAADAGGVLSVGLASATYALATTVIFGSLMSFLNEGGWWKAVWSEFTEAPGTLSVQVLLGTCLALAVLAIPALAPVALLTAVLVLAMHRHWFMVARDREQIDELLRATAEIHGSLTTTEVERRLVGAIHRMISAQARLAPAGTEIPSGGTAIELRTSASADQVLVVTRGHPMEPTEVTICETLARVAEVSFRMASLLEDKEVQARHLTEIIQEREVFLAATAHQLRTPLTAMVGFSSLLWQEADDSQMMKEMMAHLVGQAGEMTHHLDNLLVSSRAVTDSVNIADENVDLLHEANRAVDALAPGSVVTIEGASSLVRADAVRVHHILRNLLLNAQQHGGPTVTLRVTSDGTIACASVIDDGPGVLPGYEAAVFDSIRAQPRGSSSPDSPGLGLHVARLLAKMMGGDVVFRREAASTVFELQLPEIRTGTRPQS